MRFGRSLNLQTKHLESNRASAFSFLMMDTPNGLLIKKRKGKESKRENIKYLRGNALYKNAWLSGHRREPYNQQSPRRRRRGGCSVGRVYLKIETGVSQCSLSGGIIPESIIVPVEPGSPSRLVEVDSPVGQLSVDPAGGAGELGALGECFLLLSGVLFLELVVPCR